MFVFIGKALNLVGPGVNHGIGKAGTMDSGISQLLNWLHEEAIRELLGHFKDIKAKIIILESLVHLLDLFDYNVSLHCLHIFLDFCLLPNVFLEFFVSFGGAIANKITLPVLYDFIEFLYDLLWDKFRPLFATKFFQFPLNLVFGHLYKILIRRCYFLCKVPLKVQVVRLLEIFALFFLLLALVKPNTFYHLRHVTIFSLALGRQWLNFLHDDDKGDFLVAIEVFMPLNIFCEAEARSNFQAIT